MNWKKSKPKFTENCLLLTAVKFRGKYEYQLFEITRVNFGDGWYWGIFTSDGDEWGDIADFKADLYCVLPLLP
jgi:hypothetical protein